MRLSSIMVLAHDTDRKLTGVLFSDSIQYNSILLRKLSGRNLNTMK